MDIKKKAKIIKQNTSERYMKLQEEADKRIKANKREMAKTYIMAENYVALT